MVVEEKRLGNPKRSELGVEVPITLFRLVLLSLEEILEENAPPTFKMLGRSIGLSLGVSSLEELPDVIKRHRVGIIGITRNSEDRLTIRFEECIGCSGMEDYNEAISQFEKGIIAGALESATGATVSIKESKCCTQGNEFCEFEVVLIR